MKPFYVFKMVKQYNVAENDYVNVFGGSFIQKSDHDTDDDGDEDDDDDADDVYDADDADDADDDDDADADGDVVGGLVICKSGIEPNLGSIDCEN